MSIDLTFMPDFHGISIVLSNLWEPVKCIVKPLPSLTWVAHILVVCVVEVSGLVAVFTDLEEVVSNDTAQFATINED